MTKEEKIKEAWALCSIPKKIEQLTGCYWFRCERSQVEHLKDEFDFITWSLKECSIRPKSLKGIENNNGWNILKEDSNLKEGKYHVICNGRVDVMIYFKGHFYDCDQKYKSLSEVTHYDEYIERKPPIY